MITVLMGVIMSLSSVGVAQTASAAPNAASTPTASPSATTSPSSGPNSSGMTVDQVRQQLDDLQQQQQDLAIQKATAQEKLNAAQNQLTSTQAQIADQKNQMSTLQEQLKQIAMHEYQEMGLNSTAVLMTSASADDFLGHMVVIQQVTDTANTLFTDLQLQQASLADLERSQQAAIDSITAEKAHIDQLEADARKQVARVSQLFAQMTAVASATANSLAGPNSVGAGVANPAAVVPNPSTHLVPPLASYTITSPFGMRVHPITGGYAFHDGLDMSTSCGSPVLAPGNGFVIDYYWAGGYGNRMVVDNGIINGQHIVTGYNHLSGGVARAGTSVVTGQVIALVGSTGASTGCHLHFMVWADGELADPARYI